MAGAHRIGILTSGGDAPGMNPAIRAIVRTAGAEGITCIGIRRGYAGLINGDVFELTGNDVDGIARRGGTILYTARSEEFRTEAGVDKAAKVCKYLGIDGLITIGGDGTYRGALELARQGVRVVGIPATIDNDMGCTEYTIGFDTALNTAVQSIDKLRDTSQSHDRCSVVEVMGRNAGHLALYAGLATGAIATLIPERPFDLDRDVVDRMKATMTTGKHHFIVVVAEGVGNSKDMCYYIQQRTGVETRLTVLGHVQRGGDATAMERVYASAMGYRAIELLEEGVGSRIVGVKENRIYDIDIDEALAMKKDINELFYKVAREISI